MTANDANAKPRGGLSSQKDGGAAKAPQKEPKPYGQDPVAVVGMGCRLPGDSTSPHKLWKFLERAGIANNEPPESRFNFKAHYDGSRKPKTMRSPGGMFLENVDPREFDAPFFSISSTEALAMDPQQRQLLEVVYECLENAGVTLESIDGARVGCFVGSYAVDYEAMQARDPDDRVPGVTVGIGRAILSNRLSHFLNIKGPSMTIDTACSGSLVALDVACRYLQSKETDGAIVAAANLYLSPEHVMDTGAMKGASSLSGKCHTFDVKADGYMKAEGVNAVMLKRLDDAIRDGDPIRAVIRGTATNSDGRTPGIASPSAEAQAAAIRAAYANAGITDLSATAYLECHGTGTQAGDPTEVTGASSVFSASRDPDHPLVIGSIKSNLGHSEPAAGISGLLKAVLAIENAVIPGNPTFITPSPKIDFEKLKVRATRTAISWPQTAIKRASVNSFGYGGSNAHVVVEEAAKWSKPTHVLSHRRVYDLDSLFDDDEAEESRAFTLVFSANDEGALLANVKALSAHLINPEVSVKLPDLAYTLSERRTRHFHRGYLVTKSTAIDETSINLGKKGAEAPRIGFVFTGQGAQWSQMGKGLIEAFPEAKALIQRLDKVLQSLPNPPKWTLLSELTEVRSPQVLRQPEFSQPLVTALQLAISDILKTWNVEAQAVVGHSSGEIAAACAAGLLSQEDAIKAAYYRGQAAVVERSGSTKSGLGMLAAGLGPNDMQSYLSGFEDQVQIACYNSPNSVTLRNFVRTRRVDLAYHSKYMDAIGRKYEEMLSPVFEPEPLSAAQATMFSSVTGKELDQTTDVPYWKANMVCPVRFDQAVESMVSRKSGANFLIEIGPSGALAGPISQIKKALPGEGAGVQYCTALTRGQYSINSLFDVAGRLFVADANVDLARVNGANSPRPSVIVDLPNYAWNHSTKYWYESEASKDWRNRLFPHHDLIGTKTLGTSYHAPVWKKTLLVDDLSWLMDHKMGPEIIFPAAGFIAMAIEGASQISEALSVFEQKPRPSNPTYHVRNITFPKALVLEEGEKSKVMLSMASRTGKNDPWFDFKVSSLVGDVWSEHCRGLVRIEDSFHKSAPRPVLAPINHPSSGKLWYKAMEDVGYGFGPVFQKHLETECTSGQRKSRSLVDLTIPPSDYLQSHYPMHPACIDACLQTCAPALWKGNRSSVNAVLIPAIIDDLEISSAAASPSTGMSVASASYVGVGRPEETKNYMADATVYEPESGAFLFQVRGLRFHKLEMTAGSHANHKFTRLAWKPDVTAITQEGLTNVQNFLKPGPDPALSAVQTMLDLFAHKMPHLKLAEIVLIPNDFSSLWLEETNASSSVLREACRKYVFASSEAKALVNVREKYSGKLSGDLHLFDSSKPSGGLPLDYGDFDVVILRMNDLSHGFLNAVAKSARSLLHEGGLVLLAEYHDGAQVCEKSPDFDVPALMDTCGFEDLRSISCNFSEVLSSAFIATAVTKLINDLTKKEIDLVHFSAPTARTHQIRESLASYGWEISDHSIDSERLVFNSTVVVVDELSSPLFPAITDNQWEALKKLAASDRQILWVTEGSQFEVTRPEKAMIHGLTRTIRAEDPSVRITTLDVEESAGRHTVPTINSVLRGLSNENYHANTDHELVERRGMIFISRLLPDDPVNTASDEALHGRALEELSLHDSPSTVRMRAERLGTFESLCYTGINDKELPLDDNMVEVELEAAGLNFKDLAVTMGIVPENEFLLGLEGAGRIRRPGTTAYAVGDRVLVFAKGTFANRIITTNERVYPIPESLSFEEAATLASVYLVSLYSLYDLANTQPGQRVLIHSATGGLGIACIQICKHIGAEVFATAGSEEKREFLREQFGIPASNIFHSRTTQFASELMAATNNEGVDVIINSLTGELLEESWRCIREGGTMVELGKKDMLDRNYLSMAPFERNASYRCFDMAHRHVSDQVIARLLKQLMPLVDDGTFKPITPITTFPFDDIPAAFRYMRSANHQGKIVISSGTRKDVKVMARPPPRELRLRGDVSYLLVGGLKGLCGSLAIELARKGAKHLIPLARSGYSDDMSQAAIKNIQAEGCEVQLMQGDVANIEDVRRVFKAANYPIAGVIQGAMVLRDKIYTAMTHRDFHDVIGCKVKGTWNLHHAALEEKLNLDFFSMLSSISGVVGQRGQANYAAANAFLDAFACYRRRLGLQANSIDLGAVEEVGYISRNSDLLQIFDPSTWSPINEPLFHRIVQYSIMQQISPLNPASAAQLISGIAVPLGPESSLLSDARFAGLCFGASQAGGVGTDAKDKDLQTLLLLVQSGADAASVLEAAVTVVNQLFVRILRLAEPMEPAKPLSSYGLDSLAAVELRNVIRKDLGAELTTLDITNASSLIALCEKVVAKMQ
ncbi:putative polyketide synthase [Phyllosticta citribraziliensis]|uniref:Polyketide synthase n=1 Tax=Phyllosticta citribraziliensis TaxID=989973 RepID=A0ABR1M4W6_9PEZI